jgi:hypothetical protein
MQAILTWLAAVYMLKPGQQSAFIPCKGTLLVEIVPSIVAACGMLKGAEVWYGKQALEPLNNVLISTKPVLYKYLLRSERSGKRFGTCPDPGWVFEFISFLATRRSRKCPSDVHFNCS